MLRRVDTSPQRLAKPCGKSLPAVLVRHVSPLEKATRMEMRVKYTTEFLSAL